jgi:hypothetical protein
MTRYKISVALLCGVGFVSIVVLLLNVPLPALPYALMMLLAPGAWLVSLFSKSNGFGSPLAVLASNALVYSCVAYAVIAFACRNTKTATLRLATLRLAAPIALLLGLVCVPALNPLWPRGMAELAQQEKELQEALPLGMEIDEARTVLRSKGIEFYEITQPVDAAVMKGADAGITPAPGDRLIGARLQTKASEFPCGYDILITLIFRQQDDKLKQQSVHRLRLCP